mgnify:CR=1 FL=1
MNNNGHSVSLQDYQPYAVAHSDEVVKRFHIHMRSGERYSVPYSLLPIFILKNNQELIIKAYEVQITVSGRGLSAIEEALSKEVLTYIKIHARRRKSYAVITLTSNQWKRTKTKKRII